MRHLIIGALAAIGMTSGAAAALPAQSSGIALQKDRVTATSGDPARIAAIRAHFNTVERELPGYRRASRELDGFSLEGGNVEGAFNGDDLRKITARHSGESWRGTEEYYFRDGALVFVYVVHEVYDEETMSRVDARVEHRLYYDGGRLIRRIRTVHPASYPHDLSPRDPDLEQVPVDAKQFAECVRATEAEPAACVAAAAADG